MASEGDDLHCRVEKDRQHAEVEGAHGEAAQAAQAAWQWPMGAALRREGFGRHSIYSCLLILCFCQLVNL